MADPDPQVEVIELRLRQALDLRDEWTRAYEDGRRFADDPVRELEAIGLSSALVSLSHEIDLINRRLGRPPTTN